MKMKHTMLLLTLTAVSACSMTAAQTAANFDWTGVWHANAAGLPTDALTLATDTGALGGTVVLDMVSHEGGTPHVIESEPHVLMNLEADGSKLSFQVKMKRPGGSIVVASFTVTSTSADKANIHCTSCGSGAPVVELIRGQ
jgi:hypothetical protein